MKVAACYKYAPDTESISVNSDRTLNFSSASWEIGQYDLRAVEEAAKLAGITGGVAIAITAGGEILSNSKMKKAILCRGVSEMYGVQDQSFENADCYTTAVALKYMIEKIGDIDLVLCGEGSSDEYAQQVGNVLGGLMGWNTVNGVSRIEQAESGLKIERTVEDGTEVLELALPAVLSVTSDINKPRIPSMKDILAAGKKISTIVPAADIPEFGRPASEILGIQAPEQMSRKKVVIEYNGDESVDAFVSYIREAL